MKGNETKAILSIMLLVAMVAGCTSMPGRRHITEVSAVLIAKQPPEALLESDASLAWCRYQRVDSGEDILVSHWVFFDGEVPPSYANLTEGSTNLLQLIPRDSLPSISYVYPQFCGEDTDPELGLKCYHAVFHPYMKKRTRGPSKKLGHLL